MRRQKDRYCMFFLVRLGRLTQQANLKQFGSTQTVIESGSCEVRRLT